METRKYLINLSHFYNGNAIAIKQAIISNKKVPNINLGLQNAICFPDKKYPEEWRHLDQPPLVIYYRGNIELLKCTNKIAIIGTRNPSYVSEIIVNKITHSLEIVQKDTTIISGLAYGIDSMAHQAAISSNLPTIAIIGFSLKYLDQLNNYQQKLANKIINNGGLILSEYPDTYNQIDKNNFKVRNRLISGLCKKLLIVEASKKSGTMNTASHALQQNKEILCCPAAAFSKSGCNQLIKEGAILFDSIEDLL